MEYHDNPGLRYGEGIDIVLDYITIKRTSGGNLGVDLSHQLNTFWMADYIYGKYNRGRSEFSLSSFANGHRYKEAWQDRTEIFHTPDGTFQRTQEGIPGRDYEMYWTTTANYNYTKDDDYFLNAKLNFYYYDYPHNYSDALLRNSESMATTHLIDNNKSLNTRPRSTCIISGNYPVNNHWPSMSWELIRIPIAVIPTGKNWKVFL